MKPFIAVFALSLGIATAAVPKTNLYPFGSADLLQIRKVAMAERIPEAPELKAGWQLYGKLQGVWRPDAHKPTAETIAQLDALKGKLEALKNPAWFTSVMQSPSSVRPVLADNVGDPIFVVQQETPEYQMLKALALVYLTEHELDRADAANRAGMFLTVLSLTHPWDWEVHALYARLLADAGQARPSWNAALMSIFLNPKPSVEDLKFFAFIGRVTAQKSWPQIQEVMRLASVDEKTTEQALAESSAFFTNSSKTQIVPPKIVHKEG